MILVIGDAMVDKYSYGTVERISPEAPVPVLRIESEKEMLGGAGNVARNIAGLGSEVALISAVGEDKHKKMLERLCKEWHITTFLIPEKNRKTTVKQRFIALPYNHYILRADYEDDHPIEEQNVKEIVTLTSDISSSYIIISDYGKGTITKSLVEKMKKQQTKLLVDAKPKTFDWYKGVYLIKPNLNEACDYVGAKRKNDDAHVEAVGKEIAKRLESNIVITRGEKGCTLITKDLHITHIRGTKREVYDVSGAGDTFIATLAAALDQGHGLKKALEFANYAAGLVVEKVGTGVVFGEEVFRRHKKKD